MFYNTLYFLANLPLTIQINIDDLTLPKKVSVTVVEGNTEAVARGFICIIQDLECDGVVRGEAGHRRVQHMGQSLRRACGNLVLIAQAVGIV